MSDPRIVFLFDVDNTLLDHDRVIEDVRHFMEREISKDRQQRYWQILETLRAELGYVDYLGTLQRYRSEYPHNASIIKISLYLINYPFANRLFPNSLDVVDHVMDRLARRIDFAYGFELFQLRSWMRPAVNRDAVALLH